MTQEELILKIIGSEEIQDQKTLLKRILHEGHEIDQPTLSRLLKKLKIHKHLGKYVPFSDTIAKKNPLDNKIICIPPNLIVIHTKPGFASAVSISIEENKIEGVAGTIAGDDTIFIAVYETHSIAAVKDKLEQYLK